MGNIGSMIVVANRTADNVNAGAQRADCALPKHESGNCSALPLTSVSHINNSYHVIYTASKYYLEIFTIRLLSGTLRQLS